MTATLEAVRVSAATLPVIDISGLSIANLADRKAARSHGMAAAGVHDR